MILMVVAPLMAGGGVIGYYSGSRNRGLATFIGVAIGLVLYMMVAVATISYYKERPRSGCQTQVLWLMPYGWLTNSDPLNETHI